MESEWNKMSVRFEKSSIQILVGIFNKEHEGLERKILHTYTLLLFTSTCGTSE